MKPYNMLKKNKVLFIIVSLALCTVSCTKAETIKLKAESPHASAPSSATATSSNTTKPGIILNVGDLNDIDKLFLLGVILGAIAPRMVIFGNDRFSGYLYCRIYK